MQNSYSLTGKTIHRKIKTFMPRIPKFDDSVKNKFSTSEMNNGDCFCVNSNILKSSVVMLDPCEICESNPGLKFIVWIHVTR